MGSYFLDSSALAKRYVVEAGSDRVNELLDPSLGHLIHIVSLTAVELVAAVRRRLAIGTISAPDAAAALAQLRLELRSEFNITPIDAAMITAAMDLAERHALRAYDAVQLAAAIGVHRTGLEAGVDVVLVSADTELNAAAASEGLAVLNPLI